MSGWCRTVMAGSPPSVAAAASSLGVLRAELENGAGELRALEPDASSWLGSAALAWRDQVRSRAGALESLAHRVAAAERGLTGLAAALVPVAAELARSRQHACSAGLRVTGEGFFEPAFGADVARRSGWEAAQAMVMAARAAETTAHARLLDVLKDADATGPLRALLVNAGFIPGEGASALDLAGWGVGLPGTAVALVPEEPRLRPLAAALPVLKGADDVLGPAGDLLSYAASAEQQWQADADRPDLSDADRVARAYTRAQIEGGTAVMTTMGMTAAGAAVGSVVPIAGTAVGAGVGFVAGVTASWLTGKGAEAVADRAVEVVDDVDDLLLSAADDVGEALGAGADALARSDAVDALVFWD